MSLDSGDKNNFDNDDFSELQYSGLRKGGLEPGDDLREDNLSLFPLTGVFSPDYRTGMIV